MMQVYLAAILKITKIRLKTKTGISVGIRKKRAENTRVEQDTEKRATNILSVSRYNWP